MNIESASLIVAITSLIVSIIVAVTGYVVAYRQSIRLSERQGQIELVNKQMDNFVGPLYIVSKASKKTLQNFFEQRSTMDKHHLRTIDPNDPDALWRQWVIHVFMPLNETGERIILENAHLVYGQKIPECIINFIAHVSSYRTIVERWRVGDYTLLTPLVSYPADFNEQIEQLHQQLRLKQEQLIGNMSMRST